LTLLPRWWRAHFLIIELGVATLLAIAFAVWASKFGGAAMVDEALRGNRGLLYGTLASISGSLLGFAITAASIVLGFSSSPRLRIIRESSNFPALWSVFFATIRALALATLVSLIALILDHDGAPNHLVLYLVAFVFLLACLRIARTVWVLENIISLLAQPPKAR